MIVMSELWGQDRNFAYVILAAPDALPGEIDSCPHISRPEKSRSAKIG
ncbi:MAG: hypothetical protein ABIC40_01065 [bacterium]